MFHCRRVNSPKKLWKITMLLMGKSTNWTKWPFSIAQTVNVYQRVSYIFVVMSWSYHTLSQRMTGYSAGCSSLHDDTSQPCTTKWYPPVTEMFTSVLGPWIITQKRPTYPFWIVDFNLHGFIWKCGFQNHGNQSWQSTCNKTSSCVFSAKMFGCKTIPWSVI